MRKPFFQFSTGVLVVFFGVSAVALSIAPPACACGEIVPGTAAWHWDEMSMLERARYRIDGKLPFDTQTGERL